MDDILVEIDGDDGLIDNVLVNLRDEDIVNNTNCIDNSPYSRHTRTYRFNLPGRLGHFVLKMLGKLS